MNVRKKFTINQADQEGILRAVGLWEDMDIKGQLKDGWGWFLLSENTPSGFVTRTLSDALNADLLDTLRCRGSVVTCHDGQIPTYGDRWKPWGTGKEKRRFFVPGATFALVEFEVLREGQPLARIPERVFIYPESPGFDLRQIIARLKLHRRENPPRVFILPPPPSKDESTN